jgi:menaquinone-dependent protoporphyrinogen oxidase
MLAEHPVWLFSSGPIGPDLVDKDGNDVLVTTRPKEWPELIEMVHPRGDRVFFGAWDPSAPPIGMAERFMHLMPASARNAMPAGDFRDWPAIDAWAAEIAGALQPVPT